MPATTPRRVVPKRTDTPDRPALPRLRARTACGPADDQASRDPHQWLVHRQGLDCTCSAEELTFSSQRSATARMLLLEGRCSERITWPLTVGDDLGDAGPHSGEPSIADKDEAAGSSPGRPTTGNDQPKRWSSCPKPGGLAGYRIKNAYLPFLVEGRFGHAQRTSDRAWPPPPSLPASPGRLGRPPKTERVPDRRCRCSSGSDRGACAGHRGRSGDVDEDRISALRSSVKSTMGLRLGPGQVPKGLMAARCGAPTIPARGTDPTASAGGCRQFGVRRM